MHMLSRLGFAFVAASVVVGLMLGAAIVFLAGCYVLIDVAGVSPFAAIVLLGSGLLFVVIFVKAFAETANETP